MMYENTETHYHVRVLKVATCYDGLRTDTYIAQLRVPGGRWTTLDGIEHADYASAHRVMGASFRTLQRANLLVGIAPDDTYIAGHHHIGEYGSPVRHRCTALDD